MLSRGSVSAMAMAARKPAPPPPTRTTSWLDAIMGVPKVQARMRALRHPDTTPPAGAKQAPTGRNPEEWMRSKNSGGFFLPPPLWGREKRESSPTRGEGEDNSCEGTLFSPAGPAHGDAIAGPVETHPRHVTAHQQQAAAA